MNESWLTRHSDIVTVFARHSLIRRSTRWHWHVQAQNGEILEQGEGYERRSDALAAALRHHPRAVD